MLTLLGKDKDIYTQEVQNPHTIFRFKETKFGLVICPCFTWISERIKSQSDNNNFEGNCNEKDCPLIKE